MSRLQPIVPEDLMRFQYLSDAQVSADGQAVLFLKKQAGDSDQYVTNVWAVDVRGGVARQFTSGGTDSHPRWSPDGSTVAFIRSKSKIGSQIYHIDARGGEAVALTSFPEGTVSTFRWSPDGKTLAVLFMEKDLEWTSDAVKERQENDESHPPHVIDNLWYRFDGLGCFGKQRHALYLVDAATGTHRKVYDKDALGLFSFDFSPDSKQLVLTTNRDRRAIVRQWKADLVRFDVKTGKVTKVPNLPLGPKSSVRWSPDGKHIAYVGRVGKDDMYSAENIELFVCDPVRGGAESLTASTDYCMQALSVDDCAEVQHCAHIQWAQDSKRLFVTLGWHGEQHIASVSITGGDVVFHTSGKYRHDMGNLSRDGKTMALTRSTVKTLPEVFVGKVGKTFAVKQHTHCNESFLKGKEAAGVKTYWVSSSDGAKVQVWVMSPLTRGRRKKGPAILQVHGGPHTQYGAGFFHEMQVLAAQGYTVFYSNPRGSKGYGRDHCAAIKGQWGTKDWEDLQAVIAFIERYPGVDSKRLGVMGGSYGGYMVNWIIGHTDCFAGAITDRCLLNMLSFFGNSDLPTEPDLYWKGNSWDRPEALWEQSPLRYFGNVKTPTLIIHSDGDLRCNVEQAEQTFTVLQLRGVPSRLVRYPASTSHGMSRQGPPPLRIHRLRQILDWWKQYL